MTVGRHSFPFWLFTSDADFKLEASLRFSSLCQLFPLSVLDSDLAKFYLWYRSYIQIFIEATYGIDLFFTTFSVKCSLSCAFIFAGPICPQK